MFTFTTTVAFGKKFHIVVTIVQTSLSLKQIQVLAGLVFAVNHSDYFSHDGTLHYTLDGSEMTSSDGPQEVFRWHGLDKIIKTCYHDDDDLVQTKESRHALTVTRKGGHTVVRGQYDDNGNFAVITFKDGMLESWNGRPAITISDKDNLKLMLMWFHGNICCNKVHPDQPADISYGWRSHYNSEGVLHRPVTEGPAIYLTDDDGYHIPGESRYYVDGNECDQYGTPIACAVVYSDHSSLCDSDSTTDFCYPVFDMEMPVDEVIPFVTFAT